MIEAWISEAALAQALSLSRDILKKRRPYLPMGTVRASGKTVEWSQDAAGAFARELGLPDPFSEKSAPTAAPAPAPAMLVGVETLTVKSRPTQGGWHFKNPRIVRAARGTGELVDVRVVDSRKYLPATKDGQPMTFLAQRSTVGAWWVRVGREPRWPGRW